MKLNVLRGATVAAVHAFFDELERTEAEKPRRVPIRPPARPLAEPTAEARAEAARMLGLAG